VVARRPDTSPQTLAIFRAFLGGGWRYGYDLSRETGIASGTLYPILIRLSGRGLLEARWDELENGRRRRSYRLTGEGVVYADARLAERRPSTSTAVAVKA
jgi:PadR family transcriptional regulator, regulatory protein PadR